MKRSTPILVTTTLMLSLLATPFFTANATESAPAEHAIEIENGDTLPPAPEAPDAPAPAPTEENVPSPEHSVVTDDSASAAAPEHSVIDTETGVEIAPPAPRTEVPAENPKDFDPKPDHAVGTENNGEIEHVVLDETGNPLEAYVAPTEVPAENPADYQPRPGHEVILNEITRVPSSAPTTAPAPVGTPKNSTTPAPSTPENSTAPEASTPSSNPASPLQPRAAAAPTATPLRLANTGATTGLLALAALTLGGLGIGVLRLQRR